MCHNDKYTKVIKIRAKTQKLSTQPAFTCSKLTKETLEQGVEYVQS